MRPKSIPCRRIINEREYYFRSKSEFRYALYLEFIKKIGDILDWLYEPKTFWFLNIKRGIRSYKPDFFVQETNGMNYWIEVKGYMDSRSKTKIKRFRLYYPNEKLYVIDSKWFAMNTPILSKIISEWE